MATRRLATEGRAAHDDTAQSQPHRRPCGCGSSSSGRPAPPPYARPPDWASPTRSATRPPGRGGTRGRGEDRAAAAATAAARPVLLRRLRRDGRTGRSPTPTCPGCCARTTRTACAYIALWCTEPWTWDAWPLLDEAVRSGRNVFEDLYGKGFFHYLHEDAPESADVFNRAMTTSSVQSARDVAELLDLTGERVGRGHRRRPGACAGEPAGEVPGAPRHPARPAPAWWRTPTRGCATGGALADRARIVPGDCREAIPVEADVYIIKNILEWDDESTRRTLRNVVAAARPGATGRGHREPRRRHALDEVHHRHGPAAAPQRRRRQAHHGRAWSAG